MAHEGYDKLLSLTVMWGAARLLRLESQRAMSAFHCEYFDHDDMSVGYAGTPRCYLSGEEDKSEWCDECRQRDRHFETMKTRRHTEKKLFRKLCAFIAKSEASGRPLVPVEPTQEAQK